MNRARDLAARILRLLRTWDALAIFLLCAWPLGYYFPVALGQRIFIDSDLLRQFLPFRVELARALAQGRLPLWTPGMQAGFPLFAEGQVAALYPLNLVLYRLFPPDAVLSYTILFHWVWAAVGMYLLCRSSGLSVPGAWLGGTIVGAGGFMTAHAVHPAVEPVASWLPWLLLFQYRYWQARWAAKPSAAWFLLIVLAIGLQLLAGSPKMVFPSLATFALFGVFAPILWSRQTQLTARERVLELARALPQTLPATILPAALGLGLAAIQLLPTLELIGFSVRAQEMGEEFFTSLSFDPRFISEFVAPFSAMGAPTFYNGEYWVYFGALPLLLAGSALLLRRDFKTWFFGLLALGALVLSLGGNTPVYAWLYVVPVFNRFRVPALMLYLVTFASAYLAAVGLDELRSRLTATNLRWREVGLGLVSVGMVLLVIEQAYAQASAFWLDVWTWLPGLELLAGIGIIAMAARRWFGQGTLAVMVVCLTALDRAAFAAPFLADSTQMISPSDIAEIPRTVRVMKESRLPQRFYSDKFSLSTALVRTALVDNVGLLYGEQSALAYSPLALQRNTEYYQVMTPAMSDLMNIRYYLIPLENLPWWESPRLDLPVSDAEPDFGLNLDLLVQQPGIRPTRAVRVEVVSYTDNSADLPNGFLAGEIVLTLEGGKQITLPLRLGLETADWAYDGIAKLQGVNHSKPSGSTPFLAYLSSVGSEFEGRRYAARYDVGTTESPVVVTAVGVKSFLPAGGLSVESVSLIDENGQAASLASLLSRNNLTLVFRSHTAAMWENPDALARAFVVHDAEIVKDDQTLARLREPDFRPDQVVLLSDGKALQMPNAVAPMQTADQVAITDYKSERVTISVRTARAGYLVLADSWYPGWEVRVDGQPAPICRADYMFRAVPIEPGEHTVVFEYHPVSFVWGAWISGLSAVILVLLSFVGLKFRRGRRGTVT